MRFLFTIGAGVTGSARFVAKLSDGRRRRCSRSLVQCWFARVRIIRRLACSAVMSQPGSISPRSSTWGAGKEKGRAAFATRPV